MLSDDIHVIAEFIKARADTDFYDTPIERIKTALAKGCNMANSEIIGAGQDTARPAPKYRTIVADPPWLPTMAIINSPASGIGASKASPQRHYSTMSVDEICALTIPCENKSHLWLWVLSQHVDWGYVVARAWGFEPLQMITWCKPGLGCGRFQCNTEHVLLCRQGTRHGNPFGATGGTWFNWPRGIHSEKPEEFFTLVERVSPGPYLEMFARRVRTGWAAWGNEIEESPALAQLECHR